MREFKINAYETEGYAITVEVEGNLQEYKDNFLHIFNNVRENRELLKVKNYYDSNDVTVYCELDSKDALIKYLKIFGEIKSCEKVLIYKIEEPEFDFEKYDDAIIVSDFD